MPQAYASPACHLGGEHQTWIHPVNGSVHLHDYLIRCCRLCEWACRPVQVNFLLHVVAPVSLANYPDAWELLDAGPLKRVEVCWHAGQ